MVGEFEQAADALRQTSEQYEDLIRQAEQAKLEQFFTLCELVERTPDLVDFYASALKRVIASEQHLALRATTPVGRDELNEERAALETFFTLFAPDHPLFVLDQSGEAVGAADEQPAAPAVEARQPTVLDNEDLLEFLRVAGLSDVGVMLVEHGLGLEPLQIDRLRTTHPLLLALGKDEYTHLTKVAFPEIRAETVKLLTTHGIPAKWEQVGKGKQLGYRLLVGEAAEEPRATDARAGLKKLLDSEGTRRSRSAGKQTIERFVAGQQLLTPPPPRRRNERPPDLIFEVDEEDSEPGQPPVEPELGDALVEPPAPTDEEPERPAPAEHKNKQPRIGHQNKISHAGFYRDGQYRPFIGNEALIVEALNSSPRKAPLSPGAVAEFVRGRGIRITNAEAATALAALRVRLPKDWLVEDQLPGQEHKGWRLGAGIRIKQQHKQTKRSSGN